MLDVLFYLLLAGLPISLFLLCYGLIFPQKAFFCGGNRSRKKVLYVTVGMFLGCLAMAKVLQMFGVGVEKPAPQQTVTVPVQAAAAPPPEKVLPSPEEQVAAMSAKMRAEKEKAAERKKDEAFATCRNLINANVKHPRTVDVSILQVVNNMRENGQIFVVIPFTAKNDFGMEIDMEATCHIWDGHEPKITLRNRK